MELVLTPDMIAVMVILAITIGLFASDVIPVDLAALSILVLLALTAYAWPSFFPGHHLLDIKTDLFNGFSSNAVMSIIAVMIIGEGLNKCGIMARLAGGLIKVGGQSGRRILPLLSGSAATISSFMQNIGAAALLLPVAHFVALRTGLSMSQLLMPMGFCAILGGTVTMIGSSPLILLNDLVLNANSTLPEGVPPMQTFDLFEISPVGLVLVAVGIAYFMIAGKRVLPSEPARCDEDEEQDSYLRRMYGLCGEIHELVIPPGSPLIGKSLEEVEESTQRRVIIIACCMGRKTLVSPAWNTTFGENDTLAVVADQSEAVAFARIHQLVMKTR
ncbi:MAG: SLC13 family permease, partial [Pseudomonadota bacterium]